MKSSVIKSNFYTIFLSIKCSTPKNKFLHPTDIFDTWK